MSRQVLRDDNIMNYRRRCAPWACFAQRVTLEVCFVAHQRVRFGRGNLSRSNIKRFRPVFTFFFFFQIFKFLQVKQMLAIIFQSSRMNRVTKRYKYNTA